MIHNNVEAVELEIKPCLWIETYFDIFLFFRISSSLLLQNYSGHVTHFNMG